MVRPSGASWLALLVVISSACVSVDQPVTTFPSGPTSGSTAAPVATSAPTAGATYADGSVIFSDDFEGSTRYLSDASVSGLGRAEYADGVFRVTSDLQTSANYMGGATVSPCLGRDCREADVLHEDLAMVAVEVDATQTAGSEQGWYGIACGYEGTGPLGGFLGFAISSNGRHYAITRNLHPGEDPFPTVLGGATRGEVVAAIRPGLGATNRLRAECGRERAALIVNDQLVATATNEGQPESGSKMGIALFAAAGQDESISVEFDNLVARELGAEPAAAPQPALIFEDPLTQDLGYWATGRVAMTTTEMTGEGMHIDFTQAGAGFNALPSTHEPGVDTVTEVTFALEGGPGGAVALMCRSQPTNWYAYYFWVDEFGDPYLSLLALDRIEDPVILSDWTYVEELAAEPGTPVALRLDCVGSQLTGYANGVPYVDAEHTTITESGPSGIIMEALPEQAHSAFLFRDFRVSRP